MSKLSSINLANRIFGLDVLRALAIFLVLFQNAGLNPYSVELGRFGVELFFVLSGFLIGNILLKDFENFDGVKTVKNFWVRRWFRTLPLYYLALLVQIIINGEFQKEYLYYVFFLQNNFFGSSLYGVSWSLVIEEWFYLGLPFVFYTGYKFFNKISIKFIVIAIVLFIFQKLIFVHIRNTPLDGIGSNILLRYDTMLFGVLMAAIKRQKGQCFDLINNKRIFIVSFLIVLLLQIFHREVTSGFGFESVEKVGRSLFFSLNSFFIALTLPYFHSGPFFNLKLKSIKPFWWFTTWLSILSYGLYLFHMNIFHLTANFYQGDFKFILDLLLGMAICYPIHLFYERPMTNLRDL